MEGSEKGERIIKSVCKSILILGIPCYLAFYNTKLVDGIFNFLSDHWDEILFGVIFALSFSAVTNFERFSRLGNLLKFNIRSILDFILCGTLALASCILFRCCMNGDYIIFICAAVWVFIILVGYYYPITKVKSTEYKEVVDLLGRNHFAKGLGELLRDEAQHASKKILSKRIAILGEWGVGKTNFLRLLQKDLLENNKRGESEFKVTMVNPWHAKSADEAWIVIANGIDEALGIYRGFLKLKQWSFVQWFLSFLGVEGLTTSALKGISSSDVEGAEKYINKVNSALKEKDYKVVIMVDDMERSSFSTIREIFSVIDQLEKFDHCSFVFAIDVDRIKKAFLEECSNEKLATEEAKGFVDKVFDVQWEIENPEEIEVKELVKFEMKEEMKLYPKLYDALDRLHFPSNPRLVKRFIDKAKMTERMFLNQRYKVNEHQFDVMFQIMLSDMVVDGTKRIILEKKDILKK